MREIIVTTNVSKKIGSYKKLGIAMIPIILVSFVLVVAGVTSDATPLTLDCLRQ